MSDIKERLRDSVQKMRRTPLSILILAPMMQEAADHIATLEASVAANQKDASKGPFAYCEACQKSGMSNCGYFTECDGATCITCHQKLNPFNADTRDAERYRWLRNKSNDSYRSAPMVCTNPIDKEHSKLVYGEDLDAVIDYAIEKDSAPDTSTQEVG